jgi:hypothetical protein
MAEIFEHDRQIVRKFPRREVEAASGIKLLQFDHSLAAVATVPVQVLKKVQRERSAAIEKIYIAFLRLEKIVGADLVDQAEKFIALVRCDVR